VRFGRCCAAGTPIAMRSPSVVGTMDKLPIVSLAGIRCDSRVKSASSASFCNVGSGTLLRSRVFNSSRLPPRDVIGARARALQHLGQLMESRRASRVSVRVTWQSAKTLCRSPNGQLLDFPVPSWSRANASSPA
jgi:hypothetical protein